MAAVNKPKFANKNDLISLYSVLPEPQKSYAKKWIDELLFMQKLLKELQRDIVKNGSVITATNGNGFEVRTENPAVKSYNTTIRNYNATLNHLIDIIPEEAASDALSVFLNKNK